MQRRAAAIESRYSRSTSPTGSSSPNAGRVARDSHLDVTQVGLEIGRPWIVVREGRT
jgi:hypothetical protein